MLGKWIASFALVAVPLGVWIATGGISDREGYALLDRLLWGRWSIAVALANLALTGVCLVALRVVWTARLLRSLQEAMLVVASVAATLGVLEIPALFGFHYGTWVALPDHMRLTRIKPWDNLHNLRDDELIFRHRPGLHFSGAVQGDLVGLYGIATTRAYAVDVRYDDQGFRNPSDRKDVRISLIGDSFVEGALVGEAELVSSRLASELGVAVANLGTSGYGPQQQLVVLKRYALPEHPALVLWLFFEGNDLIDSARYRAFLDDPENYLRSGDVFAERSLTINALWLLSILTEPIRVADSAEATRRSCLYSDRSGEMQRLYFAFEGKALTDSDLSELEIVEQSWTAAQALCSGGGVGFGLVYVPTKFRVFESACQIGSDTLLAGWKPHDLPERIARFANDSGIPFLDLSPILQAAAADGIASHFPDDGHWNAEGHRLAAHAIADFVRQRFHY